MSRLCNEKSPGLLGGPGLKEHPAAKEPRSGTDQRITSGPAGFGRN
jgi:hypothetical protein